MPLSLAAVRRAAVPLVAVETADPAATIVNICRSLNGSAQTVPIIRWDSVGAFAALNDSAGTVLPTLCNGADPSMVTNPTDALAFLVKAPERALVFMLNAQRYWDVPTVAQGIWNCRDTYKSNGATLVLLAPSTNTLPPDIRNDVLALSEESPTADELLPMVESLAKDAKATVKNAPAVVDTLLGYSSLFAAEQALAVNIAPDGVNMRGLFTTKVRGMRDTAGLEISLPSRTFADLAGNAGIKSFLKMYLKGKRKPRVVFHLDEIEKMIAGSTSDLSGTTQAVMEAFLYWTEERKVDGAILYGVPGAGKTATVDCTAGEAGVPRARGSMSSVKGSLVGQSEQNIKRMLAAVDAMGQGNVLMLATCNSMDTLPPEVQARFRLGIFFYDYPNDEEAAALWKYYTARYKIKDKVPAGVGNWVGREVEAACYRADLFGVSLAEACKTIVPMCVSNASRMATLRNSASGRYQSAAYQGVYQTATVQQQPAGRKIGA